MSSPIQQAALKACRHFMVPIARFLLRNGVGYREFAEISKLAFVEVASNEYGIRGRKTNMSRVAVLTGLPRKQVAKIRESNISRTMEKDHLNRPELVLEAWSSRPPYISRSGRARMIPLEGSAPSFAELVRTVGGDIPPKAMLKELLRAKSVARAGDKVKLVSKSFVPQPDDPTALGVAGDAINDLVTTLEFNLTCRTPGRRYLERRVYSEHLDRAGLNAFRELSRRRGEMLLEELDDWISASVLTAKADRANSSNRRRVGLGVYYFDQPK